MDNGDLLPLTADRKAELLHRLRRAEGQVRGLQKLPEDGADCRKIAQQLLATRHALDSTYVRLNLSVAEQELAVGQCDGGVSPAAVVEVLDRLQTRLGRSRSVCYRRSALCSRPGADAQRSSQASLRAKLSDKKACDRLMQFGNDLCAV